MRSSRGHLVKASGLRWVSLSLLAPIPWAGRVWSPPFLTVLAPSERFAQERGRSHKRLTDWTRQALLQTARWLPGRRIVAVTDSGYAALDLLAAVRHRVGVVSRLRLDARLFDPAPPRKRRAIGRPPVKGARLPSLKERLESPATRWRKVSIDGWCGRTERRLHIASGTALWHPPGMRVAIRWVLVRDPSGEREPQAFLCTDLSTDPADILRWFVRRWRVETTFEEARRHLGLPTGALATLAAKSSAQNAYMVSCLLASHGFVYLEAPFIVQLLPAMLAAARGAVFNGIPPYDLWEHPPALGKLPPHGSDAGSYLVAEVFGARSVILLKDVDGLYTADPKVEPDATFIPEIRASELVRMGLPTLPIEPVLLDLLTRAKLARSVRIVNGLVPGNLSRALAGEPVGTVIYT